MKRVVPVVRGFIRGLQFGVNVAGLAVLIIYIALAGAPVEVEVDPLGWGAGR